MTYIKEDVKNVRGKQTEASCPRCNKLHNTWIDWQGRGKPRKFCPECNHVISNMQGGMDDCHYHKYAAIHHSQGRP